MANRPTNNSGMSATPITDVIRQAVVDYMETGGTIYALARDSGVDVGTLHRWWTDNRDIRASTIDALCAHLKITARQSRRGKPAGR